MPRFLDIVIKITIKNLLKRYEKGRRSLNFRTFALRLVEF